MKMNKKLFALMMSFVVVGSVFVGCGKTQTNDSSQEIVNENQENTTEETPAEEVIEEVTEESYGDVDPTPAQELFYVVTNGIETPVSMQMTEEMFADTYGIDTNLLDSYYVAMPMMNVHADEVAVFELKDAADADAVKAGIEKRQQGLEAQWKSYLPEQLELVQNYKVEVKDNKVIFVISSQADQIIENFKAAQ